MLIGYIELSMFSYLWGTPPGVSVEPTNPSTIPSNPSTIPSNPSTIPSELTSASPIVFIAPDVSVSVAESVTAGALANSLCSEPGASGYFKGGIVAYSKASKKELLKIDMTYAEENNFANPYTTMEMAKSIISIFKSRIGMATTGYSLPYSRQENKERHECALSVEHPYAYIALYDSVNGTEIIVREDYTYNLGVPDVLQRASVQAKIAIKGALLYKKYADKLKG
jgi:PncC family amidohydrolase